MAGDRQKAGYLWGNDQLKFANDTHYERAMNADDLTKEEYWAQSVFHGPSYARQLSQEIFQKKTRNNVTNIVDTSTLINNDDPNVVNNVLSREKRNQVRYSRITTDNTNYENRPLSPEVITRTLFTISEISTQCNEDQVKVLCYFLVREKIEWIVMDSPVLNTEFTTIRSFVEEIWKSDISSFNSLNSFIGSKYRAEQARKSLSTLITNRFPSLVRKVK